MKNKILFIFILFTLFCIFAIFKFETAKLKEYKVLEVIRADLFYVDFNNNNKIDENELCKLKDIYSISDDLNNFTIKNSQDLKITKLEYLKAGFIAQNWAKDNLKGKNIKIKFQFYDKVNNFNYIKAEFNNKDLGIFYLENGLGFANQSANSNYYVYENINQIKANSNEISKLNFVILNLNSNIFHKLNCEYIDLMYKAKLILVKHSKNYIPCKNCHNNIETVIPNKKDNNIIFHKDFGLLEIYFTNPLIYKMPDKSCSNLICQKLIEEINNAKASIDIALYGFGDMDKIFNALQNANKRGVKIRSVVDYSKKMDELYPKTKDFIKEFDAHTDNSEIIMHNKFFIFDNKKVITGSANISPSGLGGYSANSILLIKSENIAKRYKNEFEQMYGGKFSNSKSKFDIVKDEYITVYFSPKDNIKETIISKINNAKDEICISAFYLTQKEVIQSLISAKEKGVNIFIILDAVSANNFKERVNLLRKSKIALIVENWGGKNHEKTILIDKKVLIIGSANISNTAYTKNDENIVIIENSKCAELYRNYFFYLFNSIDKKFLKFIPRAEGKESINSCSDGIDNNFDGKIDKDDEACSK